MAACVVDLLEVVQIHKQQGADLPRLAGTGHRLLRAVEQHAAVGQLRERVEIRQMVRERLGLLALGDVPRQRDEALDRLAGPGLSGNREFKPVRTPLQAQRELVPCRIPCGAGRLQCGTAARNGFRRHDVLQPLAHKTVCHLGQQCQVATAAVKNAAFLVDFHQQIGNGVEGAGQFVARAAQLGRHAVSKRLGPGAASGQQPRKPAQYDAEHHAKQRRDMVRFVFVTVFKGWQWPHAKRPGAAAKLHLAEQLARSADGLHPRVGKKLLQAFRGRAVDHIQGNVRFKFAREPGDDIGHVKRGRHPAAQSVAALLGAFRRSTLGIDRQVHHQFLGGARSVLLQGQHSRYCQRTGVRSTLQRIAGRWNGVGIQPQRTLVVSIQGFNVRHGRIQGPHPGWADGVVRKAALAHVLDVRGQLPLR